MAVSEDVGWEPKAEVVEEGAATEVEDAGRVFQNLTLQSKELERARSPKSTGPLAGWKSRLITGAVWPL